MENNGCTIFRTKDKTASFTIMLNEVFQRADLSARAKGLYGYMMTLPDDWKIYKQEIYKHFSDGKTRLDNAFKELENIGYIKKKRVRGEDNLFHGWSYEIRESVESPISGFPKVGKAESRETRKSENLSLLNTDLNKELITPITNTTIAETKVSPAPEEKLPAVKKADTELYNSIKQAFLSKNGDRFTNYGKEGTAIKQIITKAHAREPSAPEDLIRQMMAKFWELKSSGDRFWSKQPFLPSALNATGIWDRVLEEFRENAENDTDRWIQEAMSGS